MDGEDFIVDKMMIQIHADLTTGRVDEGFEPLTFNQIQSIISKNCDIIHKTAREFIQDHPDDWHKPEDDWIREYCYADPIEMLLIISGSEDLEIPISIEGEDYILAKMIKSIRTGLTDGRIDNNLNPLSDGEIQKIIDKHVSGIRNAARAFIILNPLDWYIALQDCISEYCYVDPEDMVLLFPKQVKNQSGREFF